MRTPWRSGAGRAALIVLLGCARAGEAAHPGAPGVDVTEYARLLRMADTRQLDTALVRRMLRSPSSAARAAAARAVGQVHGSGLAGPLRTLVSDPDTAVAANAAFALGLLRDSASVSALAAALTAPTPVAVEAAWALGQLGAPAADVIARALAAPERPPAVLGALLLAAAKLRPVPLAAVTPWLAHRSADVRWRAAYAIARPYVAAGVRSLLPLAHDSAPRVRVQVARALSRRAAGDSLAPQALPVLDTLARDPDAHVRIEAIRSLGTYGGRGRSAVLEARRDPDANVRVTVAQTLASVLDARAAEWADAWAADTGFMYRASLLASAMEVGAALPPISGVPDRAGWSDRADWRYRAALARAAARAPSLDRARPIALRALRDPDGRVRAAGYGALVATVDTGRPPTWWRETMEAALGDDDPYVRATAIRALARTADASGAARVLAAYRRAMRDSVNDAREASLRFLARAWRRDSTAFEDSLEAAIRALPAPADPLLRAAVDSEPLFAAWRAAPRPAGRPLAWYEERVRTLVLPALAGRLPQAEIRTARGPIVVELFALDAPLTVDNFLTLVASGHYRHLAFHRVVPGFVAQDGDPRGDGNGGPAHAIRDELNRRRYERGAVGMALSGPDTGGSQYFLTLSPQPHLDGGYTVFGRVISGLDVMDALVQGDSISAIVATWGDRPGTGS